MDRLAESRAEACRQALILRGVKPERLFVSFKGRGGHIRTDFIPRSRHDTSGLAATVTKQLAPHGAPGRLVFASPHDAAVASVSQAWSVEHADAAFPCDRDGQVGLRDRVHGRRHERDVEGEKRC